MHAKLSRRTFNLGLVSGTVATALPATRVQAQSTTFPSRTIRVVVPFPPGSGTDTAARIFAKTLTDLTGQAVAVENKPGANGIIGVNAVLSAPADGYTIFVGSNSTLSTNAALFKNLPYDPLTDFEPIAILTRGPCAVIVPPQSPYRTLQELIEDARRRPTELNYGSGSISYKLYTEWFNQITGIQVTEIPYKGAGEVVNAVAGGELDFGVVDRSGAVTLAQAGKIRALAQTDAKRSPLLPDVPTSAEAGVPEYLAYNWVGVAVSAKTPQDIVQKIAQLFAQAGRAEELRTYYAGQSAELVMFAPEEMRRFQKEEIARWKRLAEVAKVELQ